MKDKQKLKRLTRLGILSALSVVLMLFIRFPIFPTAPYLEYDPSSIPILIGTFLYGPLWGLALTVVASLIQGLTVSSSSGIIGIVMHIFATGAFSTVAGIVYKKEKSKKSAIVSLVLGGIAMTIVMVIWNYILTPVFTGMPREQVAAMLVPIIIPFNVIKAAINSVVVFLVYKTISRYFTR